MSDVTPQQMRELADEFEGPHSGPKTDASVAAALRTAADQLEAITASEDELETQVSDLRFEVSVVAGQLEAVREAYEDFAPWCVGFFGRHEKWPDGVEQHLRDLRIALAADTADSA